MVDERQSGTGEGGLHLGQWPYPEPVGRDRLAGHGHGIAEAEDQSPGRGEHSGQFGEGVVADEVDGVDRHGRVDRRIGQRQVRHRRRVQY
jgi:hypothetical protein